MLCDTCLNFRLLARTGRGIPLLPSRRARHKCPRRAVLLHYWVDQLSRCPVLPVMVAAVVEAWRKWTESERRRLDAEAEARRSRAQVTC